MRRVAIAPRPDWRAVVEGQGLHFHTIDGALYWDEGACYEFRADEVDAIERATYELDRMCLAAVGHVLERGLFERFALPAWCVDWVVRSWEQDERTVYGRFDLAYDGKGPPKLLEYNADTPTALLEAAVIQWFWLKDLPNRPDWPAGRPADQFNTIHERLIEAWKGIPEPVWFASMEDSVEDYVTAGYLRDTAMQAGLQTQSIAVDRIGWDERRRAFVDEAGRAMTTVFKLYPWEWMLRESFGTCLPVAPTRWLEPPWKMILSNKAILPVLYQLFPESPYLLPAAFEPIGETYVAKPIFSREGANVRIVKRGRTVAETTGFYADEPLVYQAFHPLPTFGDNRPVVGSWMVNGHACGIGIREDTGPITQNTSRFVPHLFVPPGGV